MKHYLPELILLGILGVYAALCGAIWGIWKERREGEYATRTWKFAFRFGVLTLLPILLLLIHAYLVFLFRTDPFFSSPPMPWDEVGEELVEMWVHPGVQTFFLKFCGGYFLAYFTLGAAATMGAFKLVHRWRLRRIRQQKTAAAA